MWHFADNGGEDMSKYDGLIIPRSYSEYLNKTDSATLSQMLQQLTGLWSHAVSAGDNKPVTSNAVYEALTDAATIQQALQVPGVLSEAVAAGDNKAVTSNAVYGALTNHFTIATMIVPSGSFTGNCYIDNNILTINGFIKINQEIIEYSTLVFYFNDLNSLYGYSISIYTADNSGTAYDIYTAGGKNILTYSKINIPPGTYRINLTIALQ